MDRSRLAAEEKIRAAQAAGAFDDLPGAGQPLDLRDVNDPDWFAKSLLRREKIDPSVMLHPTLALRREADAFPESLAHLTSEGEVRAALEDFNQRVKAEWRRPQVGPSLPVIARPVSVDRMVDRWTQLRVRLETESVAAAQAIVDELPAGPSPQRSGWRWLNRLRRRRPMPPRDAVRPGEQAGPRTDRSPEPSTWLGGKKSQRRVPTVFRTGCR